MQKLSKQLSSVNNNQQHNLQMPQTSIGGLTIANQTPVKSANYGEAMTRHSQSRQGGKNGLDQTPGSNNGLIPPKKRHTQNQLGGSVHGEASQRSLKDEQTQLKMNMDGMSRDLQDLRLDNEKYRDKVEELEKWIMLLTNNFYAGNPSAIDAIQKGLCTIDEQRNQIFQLKKTILFEKKKYIDLQQSYLQIQRRIREREEYLRNSVSDPSQTPDKKATHQNELLLLQRQALEENLKMLSEEVEQLSQNNQRMLRDLKMRDFFNQYNSVVQELNQLKSAHTQLIQLSFHQQSSSKNPPISQQLSVITNTPSGQVSQTDPGFKQFTGCGILKSDDPIQRANTGSSHLQRPSASNKIDQLLSFISCQGLPNNQGFHKHSLGSSFHHPPYGEKVSINGGGGGHVLLEGREDFEAVLSAQDVNFLAVHDRQAPRTQQIDYRYNNSNKKGSLVSGSAQKSRGSSPQQYNQQQISKSSNR